MARNMRPGPDWVPAVVIERLGPLTYLVETTERKLWKRHVDLLQELCVRIPNSTETTKDSEDAEQAVIPLPGPDTPVTATSGVPNVDVPTTSEDTSAIASSPTAILPAVDPGTSAVTPVPTEQRYPTRNRRPSDRFGT